MRRGGVRQLDVGVGVSQSSYFCWINSKTKIATDTLRHHGYHRRASDRDDATGLSFCYLAVRPPHSNQS